MDKEYSSESEDDDYVPEEEEEEEQDVDNELDESSNNDSENESDKNKKTLRSKLKNGNQKLLANVKVKQKNEEVKIAEPDEKKQADDLWSSFLKDTDKPSSTSTSKSDDAISSIDKKPSVDKEMEKKTIKVNERKPAPNLIGIKRSSGGLNSILNHINKKSKINTLEKSKLDWNNFKHKEGIDEELHTYNKGKSGYLERQDFLQRTDVRQFEIEKDLRTKRLSDR